MIKDKVIELYTTKYDGTNITHFAELLNSNEDIKVHARTIRNWLYEESTLSPKAPKGTRRKHKNILKRKVVLKETLQTRVR